MNFQMILFAVLAIFALATNAFVHRNGGGRRGGGPISFPGGTGPFNPGPPPSGGMMLG